MKEIFKKMLLTLTLIIFIQNDAIIIHNMKEDAYFNEELVSPCNDKPCPDTYTT